MMLTISSIALVLLLIITLVAAFQSCNTHRTLSIHHAKYKSLFAKMQGNDSSDIVALVHSHHLLDHKPDNMILKGGKFKLRGVGCLGRPGIALCIGPEKAIDKFRSKLKSAMPQKKFGTIEIDSSSIPEEELSKIDDFEEVSQGELRGLMAALGHEDQFFALTGIDPSIASNNSGSLGQEPSASGSSNNKQKGGKKKRNR
mmetsp:Transcript_1505/g.2051  ORF Transcript_1505/g.2051 Transcript_1505/m.2051 type:complete len:200 (+) Transcript_1505:215-814(+)|eukprot:CAMPEP_0201688204 /NCGR_PEP_ID=MMETSP0578-20130828/1969_1 /ASSEMBLY_ACC=CAM_ASM_000663 /TAXON_ID=267565 /ORGANISM="Skeletonema grethea, Strain CCMP 1804" /LENGTH=199 /DNA_ID=CAMNT_0048172435 /DNA_START=212 /DNA_END=811 /DNA_ORIENTATION=-